MMIRMVLKRPSDNVIVRLLKTQWQAKQDNDFVDFSITSLEVKSIWISEMETTAMQDDYHGSLLAQHKGWSDEFIKENMLVASVRYVVAYAHTKVPLL